MALTVNTNVAALNAFTHLNRTNKDLSRVFGRISSGHRINRAADDAAGMAVAENLDAAQMSLYQARRNVNDAISVLATAEGATAEVGNMLKRMRALATQSASDTLATTERAFVQEEFRLLGEEIDRIANATNFNGVPLTNATTGALEVQVGIDNNAADRITLTLGDLRSATLGIDAASVDVSTAANARTALGIVDTAMTNLSTYRSNFGAIQNRLESAGTNLEIYTENLTAAESAIRDADFAKESADMVKLQIMQQAGTAVLAQANSINQGAVQLLG